jgi:virginiamycin B lyase
MASRLAAVRGAAAIILAGRGPGRSILKGVALLTLVPAFAVAGCAASPGVSQVTSSTTVASSPTASTRVSAAQTTAAPTLAQPAPAPLPTDVSVTSIPVDRPRSLVADGGSIWVLTGGGQVLRIDQSTNRVAATFDVDPAPNDGAFPLAVTPDGIWVSEFDENVVLRVDPKSGSVVAKIESGPNPAGLGGDHAAIWATNHRGGSVSHIDPATNKVVASVSVGDPGPGGPHEIGLGLGSVWVSAGKAGTVVRIDPRSNRIQAAINVPSGASACSGFAIDDTAVWVPSCGDAKLMTRIDPKSNTASAAIELGGYGADPALIDGAPWLVVSDADTSSSPGRLVRIDPSTNKLDRAVSLGDAFAGGNVVVTADSLWVGDLGENRVLRIPLSAFR